MNTLPPDLRAKVARRRALLQRPRPHPFTGRQANAESPEATLARLCAWAHILGPLAANRGIEPDLTLTETTYTRPRLFGRIPLKRTGGEVTTKPSKRGYKLYPAVDDPTGVTPPVTDPRHLQPRDRGMLLTPNGELILVKGQWAHNVRTLDVTPSDANYGDGMGTGKVLTIQPNMIPLPSALELLGGLAAIEGGLVHLADYRNLDR